MEKIDEKDILIDHKFGAKKANPWQAKKEKSLFLSDAFERIGKPNKSKRVFQCSDYLQFREYVTTGIKKLDLANFCKVRLCPMCAWRRSKKVFAQVSQVMDQIQLEGDFYFLFLTLTQRNVTGPDLGSELGEMFTAWKRFQQLKQFKGASVGWFRALEITHDSDRLISTERYNRAKGYYDRLGLFPGDPNPNFDFYHPHFHVIMVVRKSYFKKDYISGADFTRMWSDCMRLDYLPNTDIARFEDQTPEQLKKGVAEAAKYTIKDSDWLVFKAQKENGLRLHDYDMIDSIVDTLDEAMHRRRLIAFGGIFKEVKKRLGLDDPLDGDLVHTGDEALNPDLEYVIKLYAWNLGYSNYYHEKTKKLVPERDKRGKYKLVVK